MPTEEKKWLKFHDGQYQFKVPFMLYAGFESILKAVDERYRDKMNRMKVGRKGKASYTENINTHVQQPLTGAYRCFEERTRGSRKVSHLPQRVQ